MVAATAAMVARWAVVDAYTFTIPKGAGIAKEVVECAAKPDNGKPHLTNDDLARLLDYFLPVMPGPRVIRWRDGECGAAGDTAQQRVTTAHQTINSALLVLDIGVKAAEQWEMWVEIERWLVCGCNATHELNAEAGMMKKLWSWATGDDKYNTCLQTIVCIRAYLESMLLDYHKVRALWRSDPPPAAADPAAGVGGAAGGAGAGPGAFVPAPVLAAGAGAPAPAVVGAGEVRPSHHYNQCLRAEFLWIEATASSFRARSRLDFAVAVGIVMQRFRDIQQFSRGNLVFDEAAGIMELPGISGAGGGAGGTAIDAGAGGGVVPRRLLLAYDSSMAAHNALTQMNQHNGGRACAYMVWPFIERGWPHAFNPLPGRAFAELLAAPQLKVVHFDSHGRVGGMYVNDLSPAFVSLITAGYVPRHADRGNGSLFYIDACFCGRPSGEDGEIPRLVRTLLYRSGFHSVVAFEKPILMDKSTDLAVAFYAVSVAASPHASLSPQVPHQGLLGPVSRPTVQQWQFYDNDDARIAHAAAKAMRHLVATNLARLAEDKKTVAASAVWNVKPVVFVRSDVYLAPQEYCEFALPPQPLGYNECLEAGLEMLRLYHPSYTLTVKVVPRPEIRFAAAIDDDNRLASAEHHSHGGTTPRHNRHLVTDE